MRPALLVLSDGEVFEGEAFGSSPPGGIATGEVVFNTVLSGYQEVISDPSYAGQVITFTYPHIGNYGATPADDESVRPHCRGVIVREPARRRSSWRAEEDLDGWLARHGVPAIGGIDTRRLTRHIRDRGAVPGAFGVLGPAADGTVVDEAALRAAAAAEPGTDGVDLVSQVTTEEPYTVGDGPRRVVAYDFGIKTTILRHLSGLATVEVVPASTTAADVLAREPDGVFLSNGPGDPATVARRRRRHRRAGGGGAAVRHLPREPAAGPGGRGRDGEAALRPPRRQPPGARRAQRRASTSPARTTASRSTPGRSRPAPSSPTSTSTTACARASPCPPSGPSASSTTPRPGPAPTTRPTSSPPSTS